MKNIYMMRDVFGIMAGLAKKSWALENNTEVAESSNRLRLTSGSVVDASILSFWSKCRGPLEDRAWSWDMALSVLLEPSPRDDVLQLVQNYEFEERAVQIDMRRSRQSDNVSTLWAHLKARPRKKD